MEIRTQDADELQPDENAPARAVLDRTRQAWGRAAQAVSVLVDGEEHVPADGGVIVAFNHVAPLDRLRFTLAGRRVRFLTSSAVDAVRRVWGRSEARTDDAEAALIRRAAELLARGEMVGIFLEGRRSPDGRLYRGQPLLARIVAETGAPVLPVASVDEGGVLGRTVGPRLAVGPAVDLGRFLPADDEFARQCITDAVTSALLELSGQVYMDVDSSQRRAQLSEQRRSSREAVRAQVRARKAEELARTQQRIADRQAETAELARIQAQAALAAHEHARRAAEADAVQRRVRATRLPADGSQGHRGPKDPLLHDQL